MVAVLLVNFSISKHLAVFTRQSARFHGKTNKGEENEKEKEKREV